MNFDDELKGAWRGAVSASEPQVLTRRVVRRQRRLLLQRAVEWGLTAVAVAVLGRAVLSGTATPAHWLLMPFFLLYLPMAWMILLRAPDRLAPEVVENVSTYARLRLTQLRTGLRDIWLARATARWLLGYAVAATIVVRLWAEESWQDAAWTLLVAALVAQGITVWLSRTLRRRWLREYRAIRRLV